MAQSESSRSTGAHKGSGDMFQWHSLEARGKEIVCMKSKQQSAVKITLVDLPLFSSHVIHDFGQLWKQRPYLTLALAAWPSTWEQA